MQKVKTLISDKLHIIMPALMIIQPLMDVLSYFAGQYNLTALTTLMRFGLLALIALLGFLLTDRKRVYIISYSVVALFWLAHMLNCFREGYTSPIDDAANLLRMLTYPMYALTFITILTGRPQLRRGIYLGTFIAFIEIVLFTALPWLIGQPVYTYEKLGLGVMGWFLIPNSQSDIIVLSAPLAVFFAYKTGRYPVYLLGITMPIVLMFLTGTKLNFYSIFIICAAFIFLFVLQLGKKSLRYVLPLCALLIMTVVFKNYSPMAVRNGMSAYSENLYNNMISESMTESSSDRAALKAVQSEKRVASPERQLEKARRAITPIYCNTGIYSYRTAEMNDRFGMYNVMEVFGYSSSPGVLSDLRVTRLNYSDLLWQEKDFFTHLLGFEYSDFLMGDTIYDLENDFPSVFYSTGYLGITLYLLFIGLFFYKLLWAFAGCVQQAVRENKGGLLSWLRGLGLGFRRFLSIEIGALGVSFLLALGAAQIAGYVLRRPNVAIYFAAASACLYSISVSLPSPRRNGKKEV